MAKRKGVEGDFEWDSSKVLRDARPFQVRLADNLAAPKKMASIAIALGCVGSFFPSLAIPALAAGSVLFFWWEVSGRNRRQLPLQIPQQAGLIDRSELNPVTKQFTKGTGILYLGNNRSSTGEKEECWVNNSQARTHFLIAGTTGSGKTMALLGMVANALTWGSGCIYVDGKADNSLYFNIYALARRLGRDDHVYVLNFMTGGQDIFKLKKDGVRRSNTFNPFSRGAADDFIQLVVSLMPPTGGDNAMWQGLAVGMIDAVIRCLCLDRAQNAKEIDPGVIRDAIELERIIALAKQFEDTAVPGTPAYESAFKPIKAYLINLPGINWANNIQGGEPVDADTKKQHDFRSMQFLRQLTMLADTYGKVFRQQIPEVDMMDIVLNNRILVVLIPSLEKSEEESGAVGKLVVTALRMIMALNLGDRVEGMYADAVESKATASNSPYPIILDELGYYFTKGLAVIFAQARSLGFAMVAAMQDFPALMKGSNKEEADSVIANTKFKETLAMEDSEKTADFFLKTAGKAIVTEVSGYEGNVGMGDTAYRDRMDASVNERERVTLAELRDMETADSIMMWRDKIVRMRTFAPFLANEKMGGARQVKKFPVRLNRLVGLHQPSIQKNDLEFFAESILGEQRNIQLLVEQFVAGLKKATFNSALPSVFDKPLLELKATFPAERTDISGKDGDIALFSRLAWLVENKDVYNAEEDEEEESEGGEGGGGGKRSGGGPSLHPEDTEMVDAAEFLDSLPVEALVLDPPAMELSDEAIIDPDDFVSRAVHASAETLVMKTNVRDALAITESILAAKPPGDASESSAILMEGIQFEPSLPIADPVDQNQAEQQIMDIMKSFGAVD